LREKERDERERDREMERERGITLKVRGKYIDKMLELKRKR
jgi:hypothetical protein